jgi:hypothetical protein
MLKTGQQAARDFAEQWAGVHLVCEKIEQCAKNSKNWMVVRDR